MNEVESGIERSEVPARRWLKKSEVPLIVVSWLACYWAPWLPPGRVTGWLAAAAWFTRHGLHNLEAGSRFVTVAITCCACAGAACRLAGAVDEGSHPGLKLSGLLMTCAPLCVLLPAPGAAPFLVMLLVIAAGGWLSDNEPQPGSQSAEPLWQRLLREIFPTLTATCFLTMSRQYNAQWLTRGLLVAAGISILTRAFLPRRDGVGR